MFSLLWRKIFIICTRGCIRGCFNEESVIVQIDFLNFRAGSQLERPTLQCMGCIRQVNLVPFMCEYKLISGVNCRIIVRSYVQTLIVLGTVETTSGHCGICYRSILDIFQKVTEPSVIEMGQIMILMMKTTILLADLTERSFSH